MQKTTLKNYFIVFCSLFLATSLFHMDASGASKDELILALPNETTTGDPHKHAEIYGFINLRPIFDHLLVRDFKDGEIQSLSGLASSWESIDDKTWIFHLREDVKFHNGEEFNAEAVKFNIERILDPNEKCPPRMFFSNIDQIEILDKYTLKIITKVPMPTLINDFSFALAIVPPQYTKEKGNEYIAINPVGSGPFKFVRWTKGEEITYEANEDYWAGPPKVKRLVIKSIPEASTRVAALLGGSVDIINAVPFHMFPIINKSGVAKAISVPSTLAVAIYLDSKTEGPLRDKRVRQALNYAVDKESIIEHILDGHGTPLGQTLTAVHFGYNPNIIHYTYDPEKAKALLKDAGYGNGLNLVLNAPTERIEKGKEIAEAVADQLAKVGVNIELRFHEWGNYFASIRSHKAGPMYLLGWAGDLDADLNLYPHFHSEGFISNVSDKTLDAVLEQARSTIDRKEREKLYHKATQIAYDEAYALFLHNSADTYAVNNRVKDWKPIPDPGIAMQMENVWLSE